MIVTNNLPFSNFSTFKIDLTQLNNCYDNFKICSNKFNNTGYNKFSNISKINPYVSLMLAKLDAMYKSIQSGYENIDTWWKSYIESIEKLEKSLTNSEDLENTEKGNINKAIKDLNENNSNKHRIEYEEEIEEERRIKKNDKLNQTRKIENYEKGFREKQYREDVVNIALNEFDNRSANIGGEKYRKWYGWKSNIEWCAVFVSWLANQAGIIEPKLAYYEPDIGYVREDLDKEDLKVARSDPNRFTHMYNNLNPAELENKDYHNPNGVIPEFQWCGDAQIFFDRKKLWKDKENKNTHELYIPKPGDIILFGTPNRLGIVEHYNHVGIVEYYDEENGKVHTIEGNTGNNNNALSYVKKDEYYLNNSCIAGYGTPNYASIRK